MAIFSISITYHTQDSTTPREVFMNFTILTFSRSSFRGMVKCQSEDGEETTDTARVENGNVATENRKFHFE